MRITYFKKTDKQSHLKITKKIFFLLGILIFSFSVNAADVLFNTVYRITSPSSSYAANSGPKFTIGTVVSGKNFKFTNGSGSASFGNGNDISGTLSYYDNNTSAIVSVSGTISRQNKNGNTTTGVYFWKTGGTVAYFLIIPGKENEYNNNTEYPTSSDPMGAALDGVVNVTPQISVSTTSLSTFSTCQGHCFD